MVRVIRSALIQSSWTGEKKSMIQKNLLMLRQAADQGANIACLQEIFFAPYFCQLKNATYQGLAEPAPYGPTIEIMQNAAQELNLAIVVPIYEVDEDKYYNTAVVIDNRGNYLGKYRKTHIPDYKDFWEKQYFQPGDLGYPVFTVLGVKLGICICYDRHFPEVLRCLRLSGAELVFIPSATSGDDSKSIWLLEQLGHAISNGFWIGAVNRVGKEPLGENLFFGASFFSSPDGRVIAQANGTSDDVLIADLDLTLNSDVMNNWMFLENRRPDTYNAMLQPK